MRRLSPLALIALLSAPAAAQQTPPAALAGALRSVCGNPPAGALGQRCAEINAVTFGNPFLTAALGQHLDEIPGQGRIATREQRRWLASRHDESRTTDASPAARTTFRQREDGSRALYAQESLAASWSLYFAADTGRIDRKTGINEAGFDADTGALTAGAEFQASPNWLVGVAANHTREDLDFRGSDGTAATRYTGLLATASRTFGDHWSVDAYAGRLDGRYRLDRAIRYTVGSTTIVTDALARPDASRSLLGISASGTWQRGAWTHALTVGFDRSRTQIDAYRETNGAGLALAVPSRAVDTERGLAEFTVTRTVSRAWGVWQPSLRLGWRQEFGNPRRPVSVSLIDDPQTTPIRFDTEDPDRGWGEIALGSVFTFTGGKSAFVQYQQRVAHAFLQERVLAVGVRIEL
jgi:uncharacterized protein YhjY with autotransporter beta-barrel domain